MSETLPAKPPASDIQPLTEEYRQIRETINASLASYDDAVGKDKGARQGLSRLWRLANKYLDMAETHKIQYLEVWILFQKKLDDMLQFEQVYQQQVASLKKTLEGKEGAELDEAMKRYSLEYKTLMAERESHERTFKDFAQTANAMWDSYQRMQRQDKFFYHVSKVQMWYGAMLAVLRNNIHDPQILRKCVTDTTSAWEELDRRAAKATTETDANVDDAK